MNDVHNLERYVLAKDEEAFRRLCEKYTAGVYYHCLRQLRGDRTAADDACQATFLVMAQRAHRIPNAAALPAWLHRVAYLVCRNMLRKERHYRHRQQGSAQNVENEQSWSEAREHLDEALAALSQIQQDTIILHYLYGYSRDETAQRLGCSLDAVHKRVQSGLRRLQQYFQQHGYTFRSHILAAAIANEVAADEMITGVFVAGAPSETALAASASACKSLSWKLAMPLAKTAATLLFATATVWSSQDSSVHEWVDVRAQLAEPDENRKAAPIQSVLDEEVDISVSRVSLRELLFAINSQLDPQQHVRYFIPTYVENDLTAATSWLNYSWTGRQSIRSLIDQACDTFLLEWHHVDDDIIFYQRVTGTDKERFL